MADALLVPVPAHLQEQCRAFVAEQLSVAAGLGPQSGDGSLARDLLGLTIATAFVGFDPALLIEDHRTFHSGRWPQGASDGFERVTAAVMSWLKADARRLLVLEDSIRKRSDPGGADDLERATASACCDTMYEVLTGATTNQTNDALTGQFPYPGIGVLTSHDKSLPKELPRELVTQLAAKARALLVQAFDGEGLLLVTIEDRAPPAFLETIEAA